MLQPHWVNEPSPEPSWEILQHGIPAVTGFARLCGAAMARLDAAPASAAALSPEALALAYSARARGGLELRGNKNAFEWADRLMAVCVLVDDDHRLVFKSKSDPRQTIAFLEGFRQLCAAGLVMHHLMFEFALTTPGFVLAEQADPGRLKPLIDFATLEPL